MSETVDPIVYLAGTWQLERELLDERTGAHGTFEGVASFTPVAEEALDYQEKGELVWPTHRGTASRYLSYVRDTRERASVLFVDGRAFHLLELRTDGFQAVHVCGEDRYLGDFTLVSEAAWSAVWRVSGPQKALVLRSIYRRSR
ncbi:MAG: hypothetical protein JWO62_2851 [Acidimicrobiaceae bacterium]|jgi:hypothetical protein|nr:hypothetical protein [Acidimicrobiaceae bacterium]